MRNTSPGPSASRILPPVVIIVMGVSGSGKSTVGRAIADRLGWEFQDGDSFHPPANVAKMKAGTPLDDQDRQPWLEAMRDWMQAAHRGGRNAVLACSALRERYRDVLLRHEPWVRFVHLHGSRELIAARMAARSGHFMPPTLLASQLATLEPPADALVVDIARPPGELVDEILSRLGLAS